MQLRKLTGMCHYTLSTYVQPVSESLASSVADMRLAIVLSGAFRDQPKTAVLLDPFNIVKAGQITDFGQDSGNDAFSKSRNRLELINVLNRFCQFRDLVIYFSKACVFVGLTSQGTVWTSWPGPVPLLNQHSVGPSQGALQPYCIRGHAASRCAREL